MKNSVLGLSSDLNFYFYQKPVPGFYGAERLQGIIRNEFEMSPEDGDVFVFITKDSRKVFLLHFELGIYTLYTRTSYSGKRFWQPLYDQQHDLFKVDWYRLKWMLNSARKV